MRLYYFGIPCLALLAMGPVLADNPDPGPPFTACHASLKIKDWPTCSETGGSTPIEKCNPNECVSRVYEVVHASPYAQIDSPPCGPRNIPSEQDNGYSICTVLSRSIPVGAKITRYMVAAVDT